MGKAGRLTKYTGEMERKLLDALRNGNTRQTSCALAGISDQSLANYMAANLDFLERVQKAESEAQADRVARIGMAGNGGFVTKRTITRTIKPDGSATEVVQEERSAPQWQADAWFLERKNPDSWGRRDRLIIERERLIDETRRLAEEQGINPEEAVAELERLLADTGVQHGRQRGRS